MSDETKKKPNGSIGWTDLTVPDATAVRDFYTAVVGWTSADHSMGDYNDYVVNDADGNGVAGICHARGSNANIPPVWLVYLQVEDVAASAATCKELGGEVLDGPRAMGPYTFAVIKDPAGAIAAIIEGA